MKQLAFAGTFTALTIASSLNASAIVAVGGKNTTAAGAGGGWDYVGQIGIASGIYLGEYGGEHWVVTCSHVGPYGITLGGIGYSAINGSRVQVGTYDMILYRIDVPDGDPLHNLPNLRLTNEDSNIMLNAEVTMIGYGGAFQQNILTHYQVDTDTEPHTWTIVPTEGEADYSGVRNSSGQGKSWGTNHVINCEATYEGNPNAYMLVEFDNLEDEGQGVVGDSGGGVFYFNPKTGMWELAGLMDLVSKYDGQPENAVIFGNETYIIPIVSHLDEISAIIGYDFKNQPIPEPASATLALAGAALLGARRNRRQALRT